MNGPAAEVALLVGRTLGHYRILDKIGEGGIGEVYRARDEHLGRDVAIKVLRPGMLSDGTARIRFREEAHILSQLSHPNIATIYDFDTQAGADFLVMECVPGVTLNERLTAGPLPEKEVARLGGQLSEGLAAAHEQGIIHRDLKPSNLRLTPNGRLKILDFGLAKLVQPATGNAETQSLSQTRALVGTFPYMAPEQLRGEKVDAGSDIWAAGVVLYEMVTARLPFTGKTSTAVADQILHAQAPPPQRWQPRCSQRLADIILKCLEKDAENRYQSAKELQVDLRRLTSPMSTGGVVVRKRTRSNRIRSLAVLPLTNLSRDLEQEYFADGMTEALICDLAKLRAVKITSRTSVMRYKGSETPLPQIAAELNVDAVVEGSVMRVGPRVRITAQLIQAASDTHLWAESYEQDLEDVLLVQGEIARAIAREIQVAITPDEAGRLVSARRVNPDAYEAYLKGCFHWYKLSREHLDSAFKYFQVSLERDPGDPLAYAGISGVWVARGDCGVVPPLEAFPKAKAAAWKAIQLDESLSEAHISLGNVRCSEWNWNEAEREYQRAIELTPNSAEAHFFLSDLLISQRRFDEWKLHIERALELDPCNSFLQCFYGWHLFYLNRCDEAIAELRKTLRLEPNFPAVHLRLWSAFHKKRMNEEAAGAAKNFFVGLGDEETARAVQRGYAAAGYSGAMRLAAETLTKRSEFTYVPPTQIARIYAHAGDKNNAIEWLKRAYEKHLPALMHLAVDLDWSSLQDDPGFQALLRRMDLSRGN